MSQENKADAAEARTQETRGFIQQVRVATRRKYTPEEKVRIVLAVNSGDVGCGSPVRGVRNHAEPLKVDG